MKTNRESVTKSGKGDSERKAGVLGEFQDRLEEVKGLLKGGHINRGTLKKTMALRNFVNKEEHLLSREKEFEYLKSKCMIAEMLDHFGHIEESRQILKEGPELRRWLLGPPSSQSGEDRRLLLEKVRFCLNYALIYFYREHKYDEAKKIILDCRAFVERYVREQKNVPPDDRPKKRSGYGTLAQINYYLGRVYRQENNDAAAEKCFASALENYYERATGRIENLDFADPKRHQELSFATHRSAICLALGLGWTNYIRGHLTKALHNNIIPARVLLLWANDELSTAYVNLIHASILRAVSGAKARDLQTAIIYATTAYEAFRDIGNQRYLARAAFELGLAFLRDERFDASETKALEVEKISRETSDARWLCHSLILQSRIQRKRGELSASEQSNKSFSKAEALADEAVQKSRDSGQVICLIDSYITRGEVRIDVDNTQGARDDFKQALALNAETGRRILGPPNPKVEAVGVLHIARSYTREHDSRKATEYFQMWREIEREVEHEYVHELARQVSKEIELLHGDLVIKADPTTELDYKTHLKTLRTFLISQAKQRAKDKQSVASLLGISRQTLFEWEHGKDGSRSSGDEEEIA